MYPSDTIAAIATPPGPGGVGVVRVSGPAAEALAARVFERTRPGPWETHRMYRGRIVGADGAALDDALAVLMRAPHSYTGEDVLELHCHGSPLLLRRVLDAVLLRGARPAQTGEFTKRAFLNGKLDLTQAEAVIDLVHARTAEGAGVAADNLFGRLSAHLAALRARLVRAKGLLEARIDFGDEEIGLEDDTVVENLERTRADIEALERTYARGRLLRQGLRVAITGHPNVGKSSLLNALLGTDRAIVTPVPGTTRDVIEDSADFDGVPVVLFDTAGVREAGDEVERIGVDRARRVAEAADVVLVVLDTARPFAPQRALLIEGSPIAVLNKIDLPCAWAPPELAVLAERCETVRVSATESIGLDDLRRAVARRAHVQWADGLPTLTTARQRDALHKAGASLERALAAARDRLPPDLVAVDVQVALDHIGEVSGVITCEDVLDAVFREFCIGK